MKHDVAGNANRKRYIPPHLEKFGSVTDLTRGNSSGTHLDAPFPQNTLKETLTFSNP